MSQYLNRKSVRLMKKYIAGIALCSVLALSGCDQAETVASSEAGKIDSHELYNEMKGRYGAQTLRTMLLEDILENRYGEQVSEDDVDKLLQKNAESFGGEDQFEMYLAAQGISLDSMQESTRITLLIAEAVKDYEGITEDDLKKFYDEWQPEVTTSHILVEDKETAQDIIKQLNDGAKFEELVQEHSTDTASAQKDGQVTFAPGQDEVVAEYEEAAMALNEGEITQEPVETAYGFHIIRMDEKAEKGSFEEEKENVRQAYMDQIMADTELIKSTISQLAADSNIIIEDSELNGAIEGLIQDQNSEGDSAKDGESKEDDSSDSKDEQDSSDAKSNEESSEEDSTTSDSAAESDESKE